MSAARLILAQRKNEPIAELVRRHNDVFSRSYQRWFEAIYKDKYEYMGEFDLMRLAFVMDIGLYYTGVVSQPMMRGRESYYEPIFSTVPSIPFFWLMRGYNRRFAAMARERRRRQARGMANAHRRFLFPGFGFDFQTKRWIVRALADWTWLEMREGWRTWLRPAVPATLPQTPEAKPQPALAVK
jgi:hypothetical protein